MPQTFAQEMVTRFEGLLREAAGMKSISVNGVVTTFEDLTAQYEHWQHVVARESQGRSRVGFVPVNMSGG